MVPLRRLFSNFADGWPGAGLLVLRLVAGGALVAQGISADSLLFEFVSIVCGVLLLVGLWTPIAGSVVALLELWNIATGGGDNWTNILLGSMAVALALIGPGAWSVDAWLFGWTRIEIRDQHPH